MRKTIHCWVSNSHPLGLECPPLTTRPGLSPYYYPCFCYSKVGKIFAKIVVGANFLRTGSSLRTSWAQKLPTHSAQIVFDVISLQLIQTFVTQQIFQFIVNNFSS